MANDLFTEVTSIMLKLGLQPKMSGFDYMREAILIYFYKYKFDEKFTLEIYPKVAEKFGVNELLVERSIRVLIQEAHKSGGLLGINELYDHIVYDGDFVFSNGELISIVVEVLRLNTLRERLSNRSVSVKNKNFEIDC